MTSAATRTSIHVWTRPETSVTRRTVVRRAAEAPPGGSRGSGGRGRRQPLEALDRLQVLLDQLVDHLAHGTDAVHAPDDLADGVEHDVLRLVGVTMAARD